MKRSLVHTSLALGLGAAMMLLLLWALQQPPAVHAAPVTRYVATSGDDASNDCTNSSTPCRTIQHAVDEAADGDEILIAAGVYTPNGSSPVVSIYDKSITMRGGYTTTDKFAGPPDAIGNPTTLNAQGVNRATTIQGQSLVPITSTLEGLRLTNGVAGTDGGGIFAQYAHLVISGCHVYSNTAGARGGGIYIRDSAGPNLTGNHVYSNTAVRGGGIALYRSTAQSTLVENRVYSNSADYYGGGINVYDCATATLSDNHLHGNLAGYRGGGIYLRSSDNAIITGNQIFTNTADNGLGGGIYITLSDDFFLTGNDIYENLADSGGGIAIQQSSGRATNNTIYGNSGNGVYVTQSENVTLTGNEVYLNTTSTHGGGILISYSGPNIVVQGNEIYHNTSDESGGGLAFTASPTSTVAATHIYSNTGRQGGGLYLDGSPATTASSNHVLGNVATWGGGGISISSENVTLTNNIVADNRITGSGHGAGIWVGTPLRDVRLLHTTLVRNTGSEGSGVYVGGTGNYHSSVALTNTILVSHTMGIYVSDPSTATLSATLWGTGTWANDQDTGGAGTVISSTNVSGDPGFVNPDLGNYHITGSSAAWNVGVDAGVLDDVDGDSRLFAPPPDLGADEIACLARVNDDLTEYGSVQAAVGAATDGDLIKVAGTCRGAETRDGFTQLALVTESLTIRGGYSPDFATWGPELYPTTLDAQLEGRVFRLSGSMDTQITPTLESLHVTHGYIAGDSGGGIYSRYANTVISGCHIYENETSITGGGAILFYGNGIALTNNHIYSNTAGNSAGGVYSTDCNNTTLTNNWVYGNQALFSGGIYILDSLNVVLVNNVVVDNQISSIGGAGIRLRNTDAHLLHTTIARNQGSASEGIYVSHGASVWLTNTIVVSQNVGIYASAGCGVTLRNTLWGTGAWANTADMSGSGSFIKNGNVHGDPGFVDYASGDYHITAASDALDQGTATWVTTDVDGHPRSVGAAPDLGADEIAVALEIVKSGPTKVNEGIPITYTLKITNTGVSTAEDVLLTDTLPSGAGFVSASNGGSETNGIVSWSTFDVPPGVVVRAFVVTATDTITNDDYAATSSGGLSAVGSVAVRTDINHAPVADAGAPQSVHTGTVTLDGSGTYDPDYGDMAYLWQQTGGPTAVTMSCPDCRTTTFDAPLLAGTYVFSFTVTDLYGLSDTDTTTVTITNNFPVADAGAPQTIHTGLVTLDGSSSSDPESDTLSFQWQQTGGPVSVTLNDADTMTVTFTAPSVAGVYTFSLTVTDPFGANNTDETTVTITLPDLTIEKFGPAEAAPGGLITYTLVVANNGSASATILAITDTLPSGATFATASDGGSPDGDTVSWTGPTLEAGHTVTRTLTVTAIGTITNDDYGVTCAEGKSATGALSVTTEMVYKVYLPLVLR